MQRWRTIPFTRIALLSVVGHFFASTPAAAQAASASAPTLAEALAKAGYVAIPFRWDGPYQVVDGKIDTAAVDFTLDSGMNNDFLLDPSLAKLPSVHPIAATSSASTVYGNQTYQWGTIDRMTVGPVAFHQSFGMLHRPIIGSARAMLGAYVFVRHAAVFDFATDTLYLRAADTGARPLPPPAANPARTLRATLEAAGQYQTFLALMKQAGLMPLLERAAPNKAAVDSLVWTDMGTRALYHVGLDTVPPGDGRRQLVHEAMNRQYRPVGQVTVFAPTDAAFARLAPKTLQALRADRTQLATVLRAHLLMDTRVPTTALTVVRGASQPAGATLGFQRIGTQFDIDRLANRDSGTVIARATIVQQDLVAANGMAHGIDRVLVAPADPSPVAMALQRQGYVAVPMHRLPNDGYGIRAQINGTWLNLGFDTGAPPELLLDTPIAKQTAPSGRGTTTVVLGEGGPTVSLNFGPTDLSGINATGARSKSPREDGILGARMLVKYKARFDFGTGTLYLRLPPAP